MTDAVEPALIESKDSLFSFRKDDETKLIAELENELPSKVMNNMVEDALTVEQLLSQIGNLTAAQNDMIFKVLQKMATESEVEIGKKDGGKKKSSTMVEVSDTLIRPSQRALFSKYH